MKNLKYGIAGLGLLLLISCQPTQVLVTKVSADEVPSISFHNEPNVCFFYKQKGTPSFENHKKAEQEIYDFFKTNNHKFTIFDIGNGKLIAYKIDADHYFFKPYRIKEKNGIIIYNGKEKPILVYNPDDYLKTIQTYLKEYID